MANQAEQDLSRRERQIMDVIYEKGRASALEVTAALPDAPSKTAVRTLLRILEEKGHLTHVLDGMTYVYQPQRAREYAGPSALRRVLDVFFGGSLEQAVSARTGGPTPRLSGMR